MGRWSGMGGGGYIESELYPPAVTPATSFLLELQQGHLQA